MKYKIKHGRVVVEAHGKHPREVATEYLNKLPSCTDKEEDVLYLSTRVERKPRKGKPPLRIQVVMYGRRSEPRCVEIWESK